MKDMFGILSRRPKVAEPRPEVMQFVIKDIYSKLKNGKNRAVPIRQLTEDYLLHGPIPLGWNYPDIEEFAKACEIVNAQGMAIFGRSEVILPESADFTKRSPRIRESIRSAFKEIFQAQNS